MSDIKELNKIEALDTEESLTEEKGIHEYVNDFLIKVDKEKIKVQMPITAGEILIEAGMNPCEYHLQQKLKGGKREKLELDQPVDLTAPGIERFESVPKEACNG